MQSDCERKCSIIARQLNHKRSNLTELNPDSLLNGNSGILEVVIYFSQTLSFFAIFYSTCRMGSRDFSLSVILAFTFGCLVPAGFIILGYNDSGGFYSSPKVHTELFRTSLVELPADAETDVPIQNRELTIILAKNAYINHAKIIDHLDSTGRRVRFSPEAEDILARDERIALFANLELLEALGAKYKYKTVIFIVTMGLLGFLKGTSEKRRITDSPKS